MALISCSECGKQIADKATSCPNCGAPVPGTVKKDKRAHISLLDGLEQRALFRLTRFLAVFILLVLAAGLLGAAILFASDFLPAQDPRVSYETISEQLQPEPQTPMGLRQNESPENSQASDTSMDIPFPLQPYFSTADNRRVLLNHMKGLDSIERIDYLDNLTEVVNRAKAHGAELTDVINKYFEDKASAMELANLDRAARSQRQTYIAISFVLTLFLIALGSLILVLLAIERNTRHREDTLGAN